MLEKEDVAFRGNRVAHHFAFAAFLAVLLAVLLAEQPAA